jgi:hypothetical protein
VEKPTGHSVAECRVMIDLQHKHKNVVTTGLWQISLGYFIDAFNKAIKKWNKQAFQYRKQNTAH